MDKFIKFPATKIPEIVGFVVMVAAVLVVLRVTGANKQLAKIAPTAGA